MNNNELLITLQLTLFGIFHDYYPDKNTPLFHLPKHSRLSDLKIALLQDIKQNHTQLNESEIQQVNSIIDSSAFVHNSRVITDFCLTEYYELAILPPVCGG